MKLSGYTVTVPEPAPAGERETYHVHRVEIFSGVEECLETFQTWGADDENILAGVVLNRTTEIIIDKENTDG